MNGKMMKLARLIAAKPWETWADNYGAASFEISESGEFDGWTVTVNNLKMRLDADNLLCIEWERIGKDATEFSVQVRYNDWSTDANEVRDFAVQAIYRFCPDKEIKVRYRDSRLEIVTYSGGEYDERIEKETGTLTAFVTIPDKTLTKWDKWMSFVHGSKTLQEVR